MRDKNLNSKRSILFVDDEPKVLEGLKRMLRTQRHDWVTAFVESGAEALDLLENEHFDVIISDMRMPRMNGVQLLTVVKRRYPDIVRIILSGESDQDLTMKAVNVSHQFLNKPCDAETLKFTVSRTCRLSELLKNDSMKRTVSQIDVLPSLPSIYTEIMNELHSPDASIQKIGKIISKDVAMTAKVLQLVNSAYFCLPCHISSPEQAVVILGLDTIKSLVLVIQIFAKFELRKWPRHFLDQLWNHNMVTGQVAKMIAKKENQDQVIIDHAFMAGMLHDSGKLILASSFPEQYKEIAALAQGKKDMVWETEGQIFGISHAEVGAYLMELWGLPIPIIEAIAYHHSPDQCLEKRFTPLTAVYVANILWHETRKANQDETDSHYDEEYISALNLSDNLPIWREISRNTMEGVEVNGL